MADQRFIAASRIIASRKEFLRILVHSGTYHTYLYSHNDQLIGFRHRRRREDANNIAT